MKLKKVMIIVLILILIFGITIVTILLRNKENTTTVGQQSDRTQPQTEFDSTVERVSIRNNFFMIKNCVDKFFANYIGIYNLQDKTEGTIKEEDCIKAVYNMLDESYRKSQNITLDNLKTKLSKINPLAVSVTDMYVSQKDEGIYAYFVYGNIRDEKTSKISNFSMLVKADMQNRTYKILPQDYVEENYNNIEIGKTVKIDLPDEIKNDEYNIIDFKAVSDARYVNDIMYVYKNDMIFNIEEAYKNLDTEYREAKFGKIELFEKYVSENIEAIKPLRIDKYQKEIYDDYVQYVGIDNNGKYIIIRETAPMKYSIILDTYSIDLPEFKAKYESADNKNRVGLNMEKIKNAINYRDYEYVYGKLNEVLKNNNFSDYYDFVRNFEPKFFEQNKFDYKSIEEGNDIYYITIQVQNEKNLSETKNIKFVMRLLSGTDFEISYNI